MRRVVIGVTADGRSRFVSDGPPRSVVRRDDLPGMEVTYVWATDDVPRVPNNGDDPTRLDQEFFPGRHGSRFVVITYPPGFGAGAPDASLGTTGLGPATFEQLLMHATVTVDYGIVLQGEMTLVLDSGEETILRPMDTFVQNGAIHGWRNASDDTAVIAFTILGAE